MENPIFSKSLITIRVKFGDNPPFKVTCDQFCTVFSLKQQISNLMKLFPEQIHVVFAGQVLKDDLSLSFYKIRENSQIFIVIAKDSQPKPNRPRPYQMLNRLLQLLDELPNCEAEKFNIIIDEINSIMNNPIVQSFARINSDVQQLFSDAREVIANTERPVSRKTRQFIAKSKDTILDQFDSTPEGFRLIQSLVEESEESDSDGPLPKPKTNLRYNKKISNKPLPNPWENTSARKRSVFQNAALRLSVPAASLIFPENSITIRPEENLPLMKTPTFENNFSLGLKSKYAEQIKALRKMGFKDENIILQALSETNGNVQLAAQILKQKFL